MVYLILVHLYSLLKLTFIVTQACTIHIYILWLLTSHLSKLLSYNIVWYFDWQGPPGVGNLSACFMSDFTSHSASSRPTTSTNWVPTIEKLKVNIYIKLQILKKKDVWMSNIKTDSDFNLQLMR